MSDWSGTSELYAVDPSGGRVTAQLTFGRAPTCAQACGYRDAVPSPNGRFILYTDFSDCCSVSRRSALFVARADGTHRRVLAPGADGVWAPDSKRIAYALDGRIHVVDLDGGHNRVLGRGVRVGWS